MLSALFSVALLAASANSLVLPHRRDLDLDEASSAPATYAQGFLESYSAYHDRFDAYGCYESRGTAFFDQCCHPRLAADSENADTDASCTAAATTQAQSLTSVSTEEDVDDEECSDEDYDYEDTSASASAEAYVPEVTYAAEPATTYAAEPATTYAAEPATTYAAEPVASYVPETTETPATSEAPVVEVPVATSTEEAPAAETTAADSGSVPTEGGLTGIATYYFQNGVRGACGDIHGDDDAIVAIPPSVWGDANSKSANCGKTVTLINTNNGQQTQALIADSCPTCEGDGIDLSHGLFTSLAAESDGIFPIRWFIN